MKLNDLLTTPELHIVEAPEIGPDQQLGLKDPSMLNSLEPTGQNIEGYELYAKKFGDDIVFALKKDNDILTVLIGTEIDDFPGEPKKTFIVSRSWTPPTSRGQGFSPAIYDGLARLGYRILSDRQVSSNALKVWKKLATRREVKGFDWTTKQYTDEDPTNNANVSFVLEHKVIFNKKNSILQESTVWTQL